MIHTQPGEESQVDYGEGPMVRDAATGKYRRTRLFILTLGYSRKSVRLLRGDGLAHMGGATSALFAGSVARRASWSSTTCARARCPRMRTTRR